LEDILNLLNQNQNKNIDDQIPDDRTPAEIKVAEDTPIEEDLYSIKNFSI